jgi:hypothetical protein
VHRPVPRRARSPPSPFERPRDIGVDVGRHVDALGTSALDAVPPHSFIPPPVLPEARLEMPRPPPAPSPRGPMADRLVQRLDHHVVLAAGCGSRTGHHGVRPPSPGPPARPSWRTSPVGR